LRNFVIIDRNAIARGVDNVSKCRNLAVYKHSTLLNSKIGFATTDA
jgi:hypothetical protein